MFKGSVFVVDGDASASDVSSSFERTELVFPPQLSLKFQVYPNRAPWSPIRACHIESYHSHYLLIYMD